MQYKEFYRLLMVVSICIIQLLKRGNQDIRTAHMVCVWSHGAGSDGIQRAQEAVCFRENPVLFILNFLRYHADQYAGGFANKNIR